MWNIHEVTWYGNALWQWLAALGVAAASFAMMRLLVSWLGRRLAALAERTASPLDDFLAELLLKRTGLLFILVLALYWGTLPLTLPATADRVARNVALVALFYQVALWGNRAIGFWLSRAFRERVTADPDAASAYSLMQIAARVVLWSVVVLLTLHNLGIDITALVAGLGVAGIAVALAVQNILSDLFASLSIVLDKPFVVGDFIIVGDFLGTVEHIGIKTTRVRSLSGEQIIFSNADLLGSRIRNYKRMWERRVVFSIGVTYQTPHDKLAAIPGMIREIIQSQPQTRFDRAHFQRYGDFALVFEVVYFVTSPDYNLYMDIQQAINLAIYERFTAAGIEFAYRTQRVYVAGGLVPAQRVPGRPEPAAGDTGDTGTTEPVATK